MPFTMQDSLAFRATLDTSQVEQGLNTTKRKAKTSAANMAVAFGAVAASVGGIAIALNKVLGELSSVVDEANKLAAGTGLSVETIGALEFALQGAGATVKEYETGLRSLVSRMDKGSEAFDALGVQVRDAHGELRSADEVFAEVVEGLKGIDDATQRAALGAELFGVRGQALANILPQVSDELERGRDLAATWYGPEAQQASADYDRAMREATVVTRGLKTEIATALMPAVTGFAAVWIFAGEAISETTENLRANFVAIQLAMSGDLHAARKFIGEWTDSVGDINSFNRAAENTAARLQDIFRFGEEPTPPLLDPEVLGELPPKISQVSAALEEQGTAYEDLAQARQDFDDAMLRELEQESENENARFDEVHELRMKELAEQREAAQEAVDLREKQRVESINQAKLQAEEEQELRRLVGRQALDEALNVGNALVNLAQEYGMDTFLATKATAIAQALVDGLGMALRWGAEAGIPGYVAAGIITAAQIAAIAAAPRPKYHSGGLALAPDEQVSTVRANELVLTGQDQSSLLSAIRGGSGSDAQPAGPAVARLNINDREADALTAIGMRGPRTRGQMARFGQSGLARGIA